MKCIIKIDNNGNAIGHPLLLSNFIDGNPDLDVSGDTAPEGYAWFTRKHSHPNLISDSKEILTKIIDIRYVKSSDGINYEDEHYVRDMNETEYNIQIQTISMYPPNGFKSWKLDTSSNTYFWLPPIPKPDINYKWNEANTSWVQCSVNESPTAKQIVSLLTPDWAIINPTEKISIT
jgi:hypothetical protein